MPIPKFDPYMPKPGETLEQRVKSLTNSYIDLVREIQFLTANMDSKNVKRLSTEYTKIRSDKGETEIVGPLLVMKDKQGTPVIRLQAGYDSSTGKFTFKLMDADENITLSMSDLGQILLGGKPLIEMHDAAGTQRVRMGYDDSTGKFVFNLIDADGNDTLSMSDSGQLALGGKPLFEMYDNQTPPVLRRKIGFDSATGLFVDEWYSPAGVKTAYIDTNGKLIVVSGEFRGTIDIGAGNFTIDATGNVVVKTNLHVGNAVYVGSNDAINKTVRLRTTGGADAVMQGWTDIGPVLSVGYRNASDNDTTPIENLQSFSIFADELRFHGGYLIGNFNCSGAAFTNLSDGASDYATKSWVEEKGYITGTTGFTGTKTVGTETWTFEDGVLKSIT